MQVPTVGSSSPLTILVPLFSKTKGSATSTKDVKLCVYEGESDEVLTQEGMTT